MKINNVKFIKFYINISIISKFKYNKISFNFLNHSKGKMTSCLTSKKRHDYENENESYEIKKKTKIVAIKNEVNLNPKDAIDRLPSNGNIVNKHPCIDNEDGRENITTVKGHQLCDNTRQIKKENFEKAQKLNDEDLENVKHAHKDASKKSILKELEIASKETALQDSYADEKVKIIVTWNMNSITVRYKNKEKWKEFMNFFNKLNADVCCFQEVRLPALNLSNDKNNKDVKRDRSKVKNTDQKSVIDYEVIDKILKNDFKDYNAYFSLANIKYSGQLVLIKKTIKPKAVRYNLFFDMESNVHNDEGRIILVEFSEFFLLSTYTPNNGFDFPKFERRRLFDEQLENFVASLKNKKSLIWTGDLNIALEDIDLSHPAEFRRMKKNNVPKEFIGQPGCTDFERKNFKKILSSGDLVDSYRYFQNFKSENEDNKTKSNINDNIYTWRCPFLLGKLSNKAMRIDHFIISKNFIKNVEKVEIHGYSVFHHNFYGSDHCPVILYLKSKKEDVHSQSD